MRAPVAGTLHFATGRDWPNIGQLLADGAVVGAIEPRLATADRIGLTNQLATETVRFAGIPVSGEAPPVRRRVPRRFTLLQVREDLARAAEEPTVLSPEDGNLIRIGDGFQLGSILWPRLDVACDEVESELGQDFPHRRRERAPLRLVQG